MDQNETNKKKMMRMDLSESLSQSGNLNIDPFLTYEK